MQSVVAVILAAGQGTRMRSDVIKVLHPLAGKPMLVHVLDALKGAGVHRTVVVVGYQAERVRQTLAAGVEYAVQHEQLGTGHAVMQAESLLQQWEGPVIVTHGDTPLYRAATYEHLLQVHAQFGAAATVLSAHFDDPRGYGRVVRDKNNGFHRIVEQKDITDAAIDAVTEINTGTYVFQAPLLFQYLSRLDNANEQGEYYLPDVLPMMMADGHRVTVDVVADATEAFGINDRIQLAEAERVLVDRTLRRLMTDGVTIVDPNTTVVYPDVTVGQDTIIYPFSYITGPTAIGCQCHIGPHVWMDDCVVDDGVTVRGGTFQRSHMKSVPERDD